MRLRREQVFLAVFLASAALLSVFWKLASEMREGDTEAFDKDMLIALRMPGDLATPVGPPWLRPAMIDLTALGGGTVLTLVTVLAVAFLVLHGRIRQATFAALATGGGAFMGTMLKTLFARDRPTIVPHLVEVNSMSFPSGHSLNSAIVYLTLAALLARSFEDRAGRIFVIGVAIALTLTIGFSRVYLGVHYPSDVMAGWSAGAAWALLAGLATSFLQRKRAIEPPTKDAAAPVALSEAPR